AQIAIVATTSTPGIVRNSKKRPASPSHNSSSGGGYGSSKKKKVCASSFAQGVSMEAVSENEMVPSEFSTAPVEKATKSLPFKDPNFVHSGHSGAVAGKNRTWKNLKQILASKRQLNDPNCFSIDAPPSFKPAKKYSDVSGLLANYTDPQSKLRFSTIKELPSDVVTGYLALRRATSIIPGAQEVEVKCKALLKTDPGLVILFHGNKLVLLSI
uniref:Vps72/YL1 C-terminal domain-containing protein n=1 Tax=Cebus imitator TaxID=2715852 RepID=A0A2K5RGW6_CEBIM